MTSNNFKPKAIIDLRGSYKRYNFDPAVKIPNTTLFNRKKKLSQNILNELSSSLPIDRNHLQTNHFRKEIITESYSQPAPEFEDQMSSSEDFQYPQYNMANSPSVSYNN
jgi:hypothetical protein